MYFSGSFAVAINPHNIGMAIVIDADQNPATGLTAASGPNIGADYGLVYIFGPSFASSNFSLSGYAPAVGSGQFTPQFHTNGFQLQLPRSAIGNAGPVNVAIDAGLPRTTVPPVPSHFINDSIGRGTFVGPLDFGTPAWAAPVPEPTEASAMTAGLLVLAAFAWRRRKAHLDMSIPT